MPSLVIPVAFDFTCPQVWIGWHQARRLSREYDAAFDWLPYQLWPEELAWPEIRPEMIPPGKPPIPTRFDLQLRLEGVPRPSPSIPKKQRTHFALEAVAFLKEHAPEAVNPFIGDLMEAFWLRGEPVADLELVMRYAPRIEGLREALVEQTYKNRVVHFDVEAYKTGVWNVPTFMIGSERFAEQPYEVLAAAIERELGLKLTLYRGLEVRVHRDRPYSYIDMVTTIDGKILSGERDEDVVDLGSPFDHRVMQTLEAQADAVLVGAGTLRASKPSWSPLAAKRFVISSQGDFDFSHQFFSRDATVVTGNVTAANIPDRVRHLAQPGSKVDLPSLLKTMKHEGVEKLLILGGSNLNSQLLEADLVDELFLTITPKVKLGKDVPTYADGNALPREQMQIYDLVENHEVNGEIFLRYRRKF